MARTKSTARKTIQASKYLYSQVYSKFGCDGRCNNNGNDEDQQVKNHHDQVIKSVLKNRVLLKKIIWVGRQAYQNDSSSGDRNIRHYKYNELTPKILVGALAYGTLKEKMEKGECLSWHERDVQNMCSNLDDADLFKFFYQRLPSYFYFSGAVTAAACVGNVEIFKILESQKYPLNLITEYGNGYLGLIKSAITNGNSELVKYMLESNHSCQSIIGDLQEELKSVITYSNDNVYNESGKSESKLKSYRVILKDLIQFITVKYPEFKSDLSLFTKSPLYYLLEYGDRELVHLAKDVIPFDPSILMSFLKRKVGSFTDNHYSYYSSYDYTRFIKDRKRKEVTKDKVEYIKYIIKIYLGDEELNNALKLVEFDQMEPEDRPYFDLFAIYLLLNNIIKTTEESNQKDEPRTFSNSMAMFMKTSQTNAFQRVIVELKIKDAKQQSKFNRILVDSFGVAAIINYGTLDQIQDVLNNSPRLKSGDSEDDKCYPRSVDIFRAVNDKYPDLVTDNQYLFQHFIYIDSMELVDLFISLYPSKLDVIDMLENVNELPDIGINKNINYLVKLLPLYRKYDHDISGLIQYDISGITLENLQVIQKIPECWERYEYNCKVEEDLFIVKQLFANEHSLDMIPMQSIFYSCAQNGLLGILQWIVENHKDMVPTKDTLHNIVERIAEDGANKNEDMIEFLVKLIGRGDGQEFKFTKTRFDRISCMDYLKWSTIFNFELTESEVDVILDEASSNGDMEVIHYVHEKHNNLIDKSKYIKYATSCMFNDQIKVLQFYYPLLENDKKLLSSLGNVSLQDHIYMEGIGSATYHPLCNVECFKYLYKLDSNPLPSDECVHKIMTFHKSIVILAIIVERGFKFTKQLINDKIYMPGQSKEFLLNILRLANPNDFNDGDGDGDVKIKKQKGVKQKRKRVNEVKEHEP